jgi:flagellar hook-length control protein FliK
MQIAPPPPPAKSSKPSTVASRENKPRDDAVPFDDALKQASKPTTKSQQPANPNATSEAARPAKSAKNAKATKKPSSKPKQSQDQANTDAAATATQQPQIEQRAEVTANDDEATDSSDTKASSAEDGDSATAAPSPDANVAALQSAAASASPQQASAKPAPDAKTEQGRTPADAASPVSLNQAAAREVKSQAEKAGTTDRASNQPAKPQPSQAQDAANPQDEPRLATQAQPAAPKVEQRQQDAQQPLPQTAAATEVRPDQPAPTPPTDAATQQPQSAGLSNPAIPRPQPFLTARADSQSPIDAPVQRQAGSNTSKQGDPADQSRLPDVPLQLVDLPEMDRSTAREDKPAAPSADVMSILPTDAAKPAGASPAHTTPVAPQPTVPAPAPEQQFAIDNHAKIVTAVRTSLLPNGGAMQIRLDPPELGALQISINLRDGVMSASFETSNDQATRLLSHSLNQLKTVLESQGVSVDKLHVQQSPRNEHSSNSNSDEQRQQQGQAADSHARREQERRELLRRMWRRLTEGSDPLDMVA